MRYRICSGLITITAAMLLGSEPSLAANNACKADLTADGVVNFADLAVLKSVFFQSCPRFEDRGKTVFDHQTGLEWEKKTDDGGIHDKDNYYSWSTASSDPLRNPDGTAFTVFPDALNAGACATVSTDGIASSGPGYAGHCDWRLPTIGELRTIVDCSHGAPCVAPTFGPTQSTGYWSSSSYANNPVNAWYVSFNTGDGNVEYKEYYLWIRAVRGGSD